MFAKSDLFHRLFVHAHRALRWVAWEFDLDVTEADITHDLAFPRSA
jgi:hypothetical protein